MSSNTSEDGFELYAEPLYNLDLSAYPPTPAPSKMGNESGESDIEVIEDFPRKNKGRRRSGSSVSSDRTVPFDQDTNMADVDAELEAKEKSTDTTNEEKERTEGDRYEDLSPCSSPRQPGQAIPMGPGMCSIAVIENITPTPSPPIHNRKPPVDHSYSLMAPGVEVMHLDDMQDSVVDVNSSIEVSVGKPADQLERVSPELTVDLEQVGKATPESNMDMSISSEEGIVELSTPSESRNSESDLLKESAPSTSKSVLDSAPTSPLEGNRTSTVCQVAPSNGGERDEATKTKSAESGDVVPNQGGGNDVVEPAVGSEVSPVEVQVEEVAPPKTPSPEPKVTEGCVICGEDLLKKDEIPKLLRCLHSCCTSCMDSEFLKGNRIVCKDCCVASSKGDIIDNRILLEKVLLKNSNDRYCTACEEDERDVAVFFCEICADRLCEACVKAHKRVKATKSHTLTPLDLSTVGISSFCSVHKQEKLTYFCEYCKDLTCGTCQLHAHRQHNYKDVGEISESVKKTLAEDLGVMGAKQATIMECLKKLEAKDQAISDTSKVAEQEIKGLENEVIKGLKARCAELAELLKTVCSENKKSLSDKRETILAVKRSVEKGIVFGQMALEASSLSLVYSKNFISNQISELKVMRVEEPDDRVTMIRTNFNNLNRIVEDLRTLGNVENFLRLPGEALPDRDTCETPDFDRAFPASPHRSSLTRTRGGWGVKTSFSLPTALPTTPQPSSLLKGTFPTNAFRLLINHMKIVPGGLDDLGKLETLSEREKIIVSSISVSLTKCLFTLADSLKLLSEEPTTPYADNIQVLLKVASDTLSGTTRADLCAKVEELREAWKKSGLPPGGAVSRASSTPEVPAPTLIVTPPSNDSRANQQQAASNHSVEDSTVSQPLNRQSSVNEEPLSLVQHPIPVQNGQQAQHNGVIQRAGGGEQTACFPRQGGISNEASAMLLRQVSQNQVVQPTVQGGEHHYNIGPSLAQQQQQMHGHQAQSQIHGRQNYRPQNQPVQQQQTFPPTSQQQQGFTPTSQQQQTFNPTSQPQQTFTPTPQQQYGMYSAYPYPGSNLSHGPNVQVRHVRPIYGNMGQQPPIPHPPMGQQLQMVNFPNFRPGSQGMQQLQPPAAHQGSPPIYPNMAVRPPLPGDPSDPLQKNSLANLFDQRTKTYQARPGTSRPGAVTPLVVTAVETRPMAVIPREMLAEANAVPSPQSDLSTPSREDNEPSSWYRMPDAPPTPAGTSQSPIVDMPFKIRIPARDDPSMTPRRNSPPASPDNSDLSRKLQRLTNNSAFVVETRAASTTDQGGVSSSEVNSSGDTNEEMCKMCHDGGEIICCDFCPRSYHSACHIPPIKTLPENAKWRCNLCKDLKVMEAKMKRHYRGYGMKPRQRAVAYKLIMHLHSTWENSKYFRNELVDEAGMPTPELTEDEKQYRVLTTLKEKLLATQHSKKFKSFTKFVQAIRQMFANARLLSQNMDVQKAANVLEEEYFEKYLREMAPEYLVLDAGDAGSVGSNVSSLSNVSDDEPWGSDSDDETRTPAKRRRFKLIDDDE